MRRCATTLEPEMSDSEQQFLKRLLCAERLSGNHLEIGTAAGGTLVSMLQVYANGSRPDFVVVDRMGYFPNQAETIEQNLRNHAFDPASIQFRKTTSWKAFADSQARRELFDFILIDASHKIVSVTMDLRWTRLLNPGGIVCFHDYGPKFPGVQRAVDRFLSHNTNYDRAGQEGTLLAVKKHSPSRRPEVSLADSLHACAWYIPLEMDRRRRKRLQKQSAKTIRSSAA